jgi:glutamine synthetase
LEYKANDGIPAKEGYYHITPTDKFMEMRMRISELLNDYYNIFVECHHHEVGASGQGEINFGASGPEEAGDAVQTIKYVAKNVASSYGKILTFMPKPIFGDNGSGMHIHVSLWKGDRNIFNDPDDEYAGVSQEARYFIGGLLSHARALSAIVSPTVNSYKRLVPGYEAPVYLAWSRGNRSAAVRVPVYHKGKPSSARIEYRPPDPSANPYLAISSVIAAGFDGLMKKIEPGDPVDENIYHLSEEKRKSLGIKQLPSSLKEALDELESDNDFLKNVFPSSLIESYIELKRKEWDQVVNRISPAEIYYYISY